MTQCKNVWTSAPPPQAFSLEQLRAWEPAGGLCAWLEGAEACAGLFGAAARQECHALTELLQSYWRCRRQLTQSHTQLHALTSDCKRTQSRLWSFRDEQLTLQVCVCHCLYLVVCQCVQGSKLTVSRCPGDDKKSFWDTNVFCLGQSRDSEK